jgi:hypothetical protein
VRFKVRSNFLVVLVLVGPLELKEVLLVEHGSALLRLAPRCGQVANQVVLAFKITQTLLTLALLVQTERVRVEGGADQVVTVEAHVALPVLGAVLALLDPLAAVTGALLRDTLETVVAASSILEVLVITLDLLAVGFSFCLPQRAVGSRELGQV